MYDSSIEEAVFMIVGRSGDLFIFEFLALTESLQRGVS